MAKISIIFKQTILVYLIFVALIYSQENNNRFDHLSVEQGLSQSTVNCIFQDSRGFMWFGTQDGLNKYDGYCFEVFKYNPLDLNTISHNWIWDVYEDHLGNLWIATWWGLNKYDLNTSKFVRYLPEENNLYSINNSRPTSIKEDIHGNLWIGTWGGGVNLYKPENETFTSFFHDPEEDHSLSNNYVRTLFIDSRSDLWIGTWDGLCFINRDDLLNHDNLKFTYYYYDEENPASLSGNKIFSIHEDQLGNIWVGTMENGLNRFDPITKKFTRYQHNPNNQKSLSSNSISSIFEDSFGNLWIATHDGGLNRYLPDQDGFFHYRHQAGNNLGLSSNKLLTLHEDNSGILWIGTMTNGLNTYNLNRKKFSYFCHIKTEKNSLSGDLVRCFYEDQSGLLWVGTAESGLNCFNPGTGQFRHFKHNSANPNSISHNNIQAIVGDENGNLWIGTLGGGLNRFNPKTNKFIHFKHDPENDQSISSNQIEALFWDDRDRLWIGTSESGLDLFNPVEKKFKHYKFNADDSTSISTNYILSLFQDSQGRLWIGGWGGGLNQFDAENDRFNRYLHDPSDPHSLCDNIVNSIYETKINGTSILWVGTSGGLSYTNLEDSAVGYFKHVFESDGLPNQHIYGILEDRRGNLWLSTNNGLSKFTPFTYFKNYDSGDGLPGKEFSGGAYYRGLDGQLYFGCPEGFISFYPDSILDNKYIPPVAITAFKKFNKNFRFEKHISLIKKLNLSYNDYVFSFEFSALDYTAPGKNQYAYKMEGFNEDWIYTDARNRIATFTNMDPGKYVFKVKGSNSDGIWNEEGTSIKIVITPPFWQTWWFRVVLMIFAAGIILIAHLYRVRHLKQRQKRQIEFSNKLIESQEAERIRIAAELHDSLGQNLLIINNELAQFAHQPGSERENIEEIVTLVKDSINEVREISHNLHPHLLDKLGLTKAIDAMINKTSHAINIQFEVKTENLDGMLAKKNEIHYYRIVQEALNNIAKHSHARTVWIKTQIKNNFIYTIIKDNGKGYDKSQYESKSSSEIGLGLSDMHERAKLIGGTLRISTQLNQGTEIRLVVPIQPVKGARDGAAN